MKKSYNPFKAARLNNMLRVLTVVCLAAIILVVILYFSVAENRRSLATWFGFSPTQLAHQKNNSAETNDLGMANSVAINKSINVRPISSADHLWGPIDAPVNLIVYDDFECPFCAQFFETVNRAKAEFGNSLVVAIRHFPLISHAEAINAAMASECAAEKNKFWEMYKALFEDNKSANLKPDVILKNATDLGLDAKSFTDCLTKTVYKDKILAEKAEVKDLGVIGTPASFLNNLYIPGALPYEDFTYPDGSAGLGLRSLIQKQINEINKK
jgi:protein-disulfide isomerase